MGDNSTFSSIKERLLKERHTLLDLSTRNRLLNTPLRTRNNRAIEIVDEKASEVFRLLTAGKTLSFLPGTELSEEERAALDPEDDVTGGIPQPSDGDIDERGMSARHSDLRLQTRLTTEGLQKRLFDIWYDAQTIEQEQGINILYLAVGLLRWFDSDSSDQQRHAPLVLLPVKLERNSAADRFRLKFRDEPASPNLTLQAKMRAEYGLLIEDFKDEDEVDLPAYFVRVAETTSTKKRWEVLPDAMVLGFFSFAKFLMYRDLDPENWPADARIDSHPLISALLRDGFPHSEPLVDDRSPIDDVIPPIDQQHVVDADSSQTVVIAETAGGRTLVVKGPPGTGKSQTITNIIAAAAGRGKKVLFVAEKMAALDVVHRRLQHVGLGPLTLELHSNKANKRVILEELKRTRDAQARPARSDLSIVQVLADSTGHLNGFAQRLHAPLPPSELTPQAILGRLCSTQTDPQVLTLADAETWDQRDVAKRRAHCEELAERLRDIGPIPHNIWRGVERDPVDPVERATLAGKIEAVLEFLDAAKRSAAVASNLLGAPAPQAVDDLHRAAAFLAVVPLPTGIDQASLASTEWTEPGSLVLQNFVRTGSAYAAAQVKAEALANQAGLSADYAAIRTAIAVKGGSLFRAFSGEYRSSIALLRSYLRQPLPKRQIDRLAIVDDIVAAQVAKAEFDRSEAGGRAFGISWQSSQSPWKTLEQALEWRKSLDHLPPSVWPALAAANADDLIAAKTGLASALSELSFRLTEIVEELSLDTARAFGTVGINNTTIDELCSRLKAWRANMEALSLYIAFAAKGRLLKSLGCSALVEAVHDGKLSHDEVISAFDQAYCEVLRRSLFAAWPELKGFDGDEQNRLVDLFRQADRARIDLAKEQIMAMHAEGRPRGAAGIGPLGILNGEIARKRGHLPIRTLLEKAGAAIQQLKPVFMMSPLSVAQYLKPGGLRFDLIVMDEASQIEPVDALGAIARANQLVVVGDERQLPPTAFFKKLAGEEDADEKFDDGILQAKDAESILELCLAKGVPYRMLNWHYRSKHQSLIAVSNREFYENKLYIVPSPFDAVAGMGLKFHLLKDAAYDRGETRTNPVEAKTIAAAVIRHAREQPDLSLGVATFSVAQRQMILKELELLRRIHPEAEDFFSASKVEPFFVKNLENIQGDERDVIFISVGYGKTAQGYLAHAFGPLSGDGGERRLNVLISRAKLRCEVFANFTGADIDLERTRARGVAALKLFLTFAETGHFGLGEVSGADFDSEFERSVCAQLQGRGFDVKRQIGASGFRVDLAIADPEKPGRFILGIECDGAQFHSSRSARDRDRLRQQVLEAHGWIIHRIWSADWYQRPQRELQKVEDAIAAARSAWRDRDENLTMPQRAVALSFETREEGAVEVTTAILGEPAPDLVETLSTRYVEASFHVRQDLDPHEVPLADMTAYVVRIIELEGPVHIDEIVTRIRILWGLARAGARIRGAVIAAADLAVRKGLVSPGPFHSLPGQDVVVRNRSDVVSSTLRRPEMLPPVEIDKAVLDIVGGNFGATRDELIPAASRTFGYSATSAQLRSVISARIDELLKTSALLESAGLLTRSRMNTQRTSG